MTEKRKDSLVLLGQAGFPETAIREQVRRICLSLAGNYRRLLEYLVEEALAGRIPTTANVAAIVGGRTDYARVTKVRLVKRMKAYYDEHPGELHLEIPEGDYAVFAPRKATPPDRSPIASIREPDDNAEVLARVTVRGKIEQLDPDLRAWLVVYAPDEVYYPQCPISRRAPVWEESIRIGRLQWRETDGVEFSILLVALDADGDYDFNEYVRNHGDGFGMRLPHNTKILDTKRVIRRDHRPRSRSTE